MSKQLLVEYFPITYDASELNEAIRNNNVVRVRAVLQTYDEKNQNGRVYPREILMREATKYAQEFVAQRRALGELDHPEERTVVNLANVSHNITEIHWEGPNLVGTLEILNTPAGNIIKELMRNRIKLGISSRGVGSVREISEGTSQVEDDYNLICFDLVSNPSTRGAFLGEGVENALRDNRSKRINSLISDFFNELGKQS